MGTRSLVLEEDVHDRTAEEEEDAEEADHEQPIPSTLDTRSLTLSDDVLPFRAGIRLACSESGPICVPERTAHRLQGRIREHAS